MFNSLYQKKQMKERKKNGVKTTLIKIDKAGVKTYKAHSIEQKLSFYTHIIYIIFIYILISILRWCEKTPDNTICKIKNIE